MATNNSITIVQLLEMLKTMSEEEWNKLYNDKNNPLTTAWNLQYKDRATDAAAIEFNEMCEKIRLGKTDELPDELKEAVIFWNTNNNQSTNN